PVGDLHRRRHGTARLERDAHVAGGRVPLRRIAREPLRDDRVHRRWERRPGAREERDLVLEDARDGVGLAFSDEETAPCEHLPEDDRERVDVDLARELCVYLKLLWGHVAELPFELPLEGA